MPADRLSSEPWPGRKPLGLLGALSLHAVSLPNPSKRVRPYTPRSVSPFHSLCGEHPAWFPPSRQGSAKPAGVRLKHSRSVAERYQTASGRAHHPFPAQSALPRLTEQQSQSVGCAVRRNSGLQKPPAAGTMDDLEAAMEQFREIENDLKPSTHSELLGAPDSGAAQPAFPWHRSAGAGRSSPDVSTQRNRGCVDDAQTA